MYTDLFHTDPSITDEELTPAVLEELGRLKARIVNAVFPHWCDGRAQTRTAGDAISMHAAALETLALELEPLTPDFIRALAKALKVPA